MFHQLKMKARGVQHALQQDVRDDPVLGLILVVALALTGFAFWYRVPNFGTADEFSRILHPMKAVGYFVQDPGFESLKQGVTDGRALGATFYLYALVLAPVFLFVLATGQLGSFTSLESISSRWTLWHAAPAWFWTVTILLGRLVNVVLAVGCVYVTYRLGVSLRNRRTGRLAAAFLAVSLGFVSTAHELGEDISMLLLVLVVLLLASRFANQGDHIDFLLGCALGGLAIAFKLTGGVVVFVLGLSYLLRWLDNGGNFSGLDVRLLLGGLGLGVAGIYIGIPSVLISGPEALVTRALHTSTQKLTLSGGREAPIWYWFLRQYLNGFSLPLFVAVALGAVASVSSYRDGEMDRGLFLLVASALVAYLAVFSQWQYVRLHHLLPTFPLLLLLFAASLSRLFDSSRRVATVFVATLLVVTTIYTAVGVSGYATDPRSQATSWLSDNVSEGDQVEVYEDSIADVGIPHGTNTSHYEYQEENATYASSLVLNESAYTRWMVSVEERDPEYVQLTTAELSYLDPRSPKHRQYPERARYVRKLLTSSSDNYTVVAEFGACSAYQNASTPSLLRVALSPHVEQRAECVILLKRTEPGRNGDS